MSDKFCFGCGKELSKVPTGAYDGTTGDFVKSGEWTICPHIVNQARIFGAAIEGYVYQRYSHHIQHEKLKS